MGESRLVSRLLFKFKAMTSTLTFPSCIFSVVEYIFCPYPGASIEKKHVNVRVPYIPFSSILLKGSPLLSLSLSLLTARPTDHVQLRSNNSVSLVLRTRPRPRLLQRLNIRAATKACITYTIVKDFAKHVLAAWRVRSISLQLINFA